MIAGSNKVTSGGLAAVASTGVMAALGFDGRGQVVRTVVLKRRGWL
jgi:hypothetical protein